MSGHSVNFNFSGIECVNLAHSLGTNLILDPSFNTMQVFDMARFVKQDSAVLRSALQSVVSWTGMTQLTSLCHVWLCTAIFI